LTNLWILTEEKPKNSVVFTILKKYAIEYNKNLGFNAAEKCDIIILVGKNRSVPIKDGVLEHGFQEEKLFTVSSFAEANALYTTLADKNTVLLIENDLPDNYLN